MLCFTDCLFKREMEWFRYRSWWWSKFLYNSTMCRGKDTTRRITMATFDLLYLFWQTCFLFFTYTIGAVVVMIVIVVVNQCLSPLKLWVWTCPWRGVLNTTLCDKVCQWLAADRCFLRVLQILPHKTLTTMIYCESTFLRGHQF